jgi:Asp-tRNA(Asn)/Glu-tRNA(Gln) amidotransferase A subunit family amidase
VGFMEALRSTGRLGVVAMGSRGLVTPAASELYGVGRPSAPIAVIQRALRIGDVYMPDLHAAAVASLRASNAYTNGAVEIFPEPVRNPSATGQSLRGVMFVAKGSMPMEGLPFLNGLKDYPGGHYLPSKTLDLLQTVLDQGAWIVGRGRTPQFSARTITNPLGLPEVASRLDAARTASGSSGCCHLGRILVGR